MRSVGLIGGTSWHSTVEYYRHINQAVNDRHGDNTNPPLLLLNLNQSAVHRYQSMDRWDLIAEMLIDAGRRLEAAGAEALMLCANTPHRLYPELVAEVRVPVLHIADATGRALRQGGLSKVGLLGTTHVMGGGYIAERLAVGHGVDVMLPPSQAWPRIQSIIQKELALGKLDAGSRCFLVEQVGSMRALGAQGVVLGCTELPLVLDEASCGLPVLDTLRLHAEMAVEFIMS